MIDKSIEAGLSKRRLLLIDGEAASAKSPRFYDTAYFFHRIFTLVGAVDLAREYAAKIYESLGLQDRTQFSQIFRINLSARLIGGCYDAVREKSLDFSIHKKLQELIISNELF
ncbi:hypothetical protein GF357_03785 [Candidatus Dojkabacteria bacterium]|nr:hypothetical protein [Candidatus Dojkabacteria bacterium]